MKKKDVFNKRLVSRRQFLVGAGQAMLYLPPLMSLLPREVWAQVAGKKVRTMTFVNAFGINPELMFPTNPVGLTPYASALDTYYNRLSALPKQFSRVVDFNNSNLSGLEGKMNIMRGLGLVGGNIGGHNHSVLSGTHAGGRAPTLGASIDTIIERQKGYSAIRLRTAEKSLNKTSEHSYWRPSRGAARQVSSLLYGDQALFNLLFPNGGSGSAPPSSGPSSDELIIDKVLEDLTQVQNHRRLSSEDKNRLDEYVTSVHELQKKIVAQRQPAAISCQNANLNYAVPSGFRGTPNVDNLYDNYAELITLAMQCDRAQVVHIGNTAISSTNSNGAHPELHHGCSGGANGNADRNAWFLQRIGNLAKKLDARVDPFDPNGGTLLDNSLLLWTNELGSWTGSHSVTQIPVVTFGSGGGYFRTGYFADFRARPFITYRNNGGEQHMYGRPYKQLLISVMRAAGLSSNQYMSFGDGNGFGEWQPFYSKERPALQRYYERFNNEHNDPLPFFSLGG